MLFTIPNNKYESLDQLRTNTLMHAYFIIEKYPLKAAELILDNYLMQQYKASLKDLCVKLLLSFTYHADEEGNLVLLFNDPKMDALARLITYGNGALQGSNILKIALNIKE